MPLLSTMPRLFSSASLQPKRHASIGVSDWSLFRAWVMPHALPYGDSAC